MSVTSILFIANLVMTLLCATSLALIAVTHTSGVFSALAMVMTLLLFLCVLVLARKHSKQVVIADRYRRLGRKLLQLKRTKKRDESMAINVLNHIVQQSPDVSSHTNIWQQPLEVFSGDLALTTYNDNGTSYTLLADLTGHGIAAAMGATPVASIFQATARRGLPVEQIVVELNEKLRLLLPSGYFCCAAVISCRHRSLKICNAGLPPVRIVSKEGSIVHVIESTQLPLGIDPLQECDVSVYSKTFDHDHRLYAFTDGLIEADNPHGEPFGEKQLDGLFTSVCRPTGRLNHIKKAFTDFVKGSTQHDDISIVEVNIC